MGRYSAAHADPHGVGDARPTALQIVKDEGLEDKLADKVIVVTGTTSGIGVETARALAATGATLFLTVRDKTKAEKNLKDILDTGRVSLINMDLTSFSSIKSAASTILSKSNNKVNILINNAGIMAVPKRELTEDGNELHFQINHLSHFLLFQLLKPALLASSSPDFNSRVVNVASSASRTCELLDSDNYNFEKSEYDHSVAYGNSKLANVYMATELDRRYGNQGLHATSLHPGGIHTEIDRFIKETDPSFVAAIYANEHIVKVLQSPAQGAATTVYAAISKEWEGKGGRYLEMCEEAKRGKDDGQTFGVGYVKQTYDTEKEKRLWKDSLKMVGVEDDA
jgi:NAD(P)-dependent dehydrogenase (short-subunit alcohol dehydrogenase family)